MRMATIVSPEGNPRMVPAADAGVPGLVLTEIEDHGGALVWSVTHESSGLAIAVGACQACALTAADLMRDCADWTLPADELKAHAAEVAACLGEAIGLRAPYVCGWCDDHAMSS